MWIAAVITRCWLAALSPAAGQGPCLSDPQTLCLDDGRFDVEVEWTDFGGASGPGRVVPFQGVDSGMFWFFDENNWEILV